MKQPIRVLHVVTYMGRGGLETMLMNYYRHIDRTKVQFDFLVHRDFEADYDQEINELGGRIYHVSKLIPWSRKYKQELKCFFQHHPEYRIVHVHQDCLSSVALKCAEECGIPVRIAHSHNVNQDKNIKYLIKLHYMKNIPKYATDCFACSEEAGEWMFKGSLFHILHNAVDTSLYTYSAEISKRVRNGFHIENSFVIGHIGRFDPQKNHSFLLNVFSECIKCQPNSKLLLIGDGKNRVSIEKKVKSLGLEKKVIFAGIRNDVAELLQAMDVFVFPSLYEGLGLAAVEAQAAGIPCILSDKVPIECKMTKNVEFLSLDDSPDTWAKHILSYVNSPRDYTYDDLYKAGYDIKENAFRLQGFYCKGVYDE